MSAQPTTPPEPPDPSPYNAPASSKKTGWWNRFWDECFDFNLEFSILESRSKFCPGKKLGRAKLKLVACNPHLIRTAIRAKLRVVKQDDDHISDNQ